MKKWTSVSRRMKALLLTAIASCTLLIPTMRLDLLLATATKMTFHAYGTDQFRSSVAPPVVFSAHQDAVLFSTLHQPEQWFGVENTPVGSLCTVDVESLGGLRWTLGYDPMGGKLLGGSGIGLLLSAKLSPEGHVLLNQRLGYENCCLPPQQRTHSGRP